MAGEILYTTLEHEGEAEFTEKRSVFIGHAKRVESEEEAQAYVKSQKSAYADARHNVWAYLMKGEIVARYSDDGEPQGTAGKPILDVLQRSGVDDVCVVVTRYFGGTLLGTGGLVHAYSQGAKIALEAAGVARFESYTVFETVCSYSDHQKIAFELEKLDAIIDLTDYSDCVRVIFAVKTGSADIIERKITEISAAKSFAKRICERFDAK